MKRTDDEIKNMAGHPDTFSDKYREWFLKGWRACENGGPELLTLPPDTYPQDLINNEDQKNTPDYFYRPNDFTVYHKREDGTYSHQIDIDRGWSGGGGYQYETMVASNFIPCTPEEFPELKRKSKLYYEYLSWSCRPDGHGGSKGGTFEEFLARKKYK